MGLSGIPRKFVENLVLRDTIVELADDLYNDCQSSEYNPHEDKAWESKYIYRTYPKAFERQEFAMFETKKTLIVVYKDELLVNQLKKMVETSDDGEEGVVGTKDNSINIVSWTEKVWLGNKKAGNIQGKILFLGDIKGTDKLIPVVDVKFNDCGVKFGWAGNQGILFVEPKALANREDYDGFLEKLSTLPVPDFLKTMKKEVEAGVSEEAVEETTVQEPTEDTAAQEPDEQPKMPSFLNAARNAIGKFRNKSLMERQMLFYGIVHLYNDGLESFVNQ